jgi:hypothetical protein
MDGKEMILMNQIKFWSESSNTRKETFLGVGTVMLAMYKYKNGLIIS